MIWADSSAWIEFDRATGSRVHLRMREMVADGGPLAVTEPVVTEVLAGAQSEARENELRRLMERFELLPFQSPGDFEAATRIYRRCRRAGVTPRGLLDCMIAAVAWRRVASLLSHDADLHRVATVIGIDLDPASLRV